MERSFQRNVGALDEIFAFTDRFSSSHGLGPALRYSVDLIVEELFTNLVKHNSGGGPSIHIRVSIEGDRMVVELTDENVDPWDPSQAPEVALDRLIDNRRAGGLGLRLVRAMADELRYDCRERRMTVTAVKKLMH